MADYLGDASRKAVVIPQPKSDIAIQNLRACDSFSQVVILAPGSQPITIRDLFEERLL